MIDRISRAELILRLAILLVFAAFFLFPFYWMVATSLKHEVDAFAIPPKWLFLPQLDNYVAVLWRTDFARHALNSLIAGSLNVTATLALALPAAYAMSRYRSGGRDLMFWFLSIRMMPPIVGAIPLFVIAAEVKLVDSFVILPILYLVLNVPFAIWMLKSFIDEIPPEIDESALTDGCTMLAAIRYMILPLLKPGLFSTAVFCFVVSWNEFLLANVFTRERAVTLPVALANFVTEKQILWGYITAGSTLATLPPILLVLIFQRNLVRSLTLGAIR